MRRCRDAWGTAPLAQDLRELDAVVFTFRGRDRHPEVPSTLGAWERRDVAAVVRFLEGRGVIREHMLVCARSQGAGVALLALADLDPGGHLGGALLESPFRDLADAASNHLRGTLGAWEVLARPAERIALWRAGRLAHFDPDAVSPLRAAARVHTPAAFLAGDADAVTPIDGVRAVVAALPESSLPAHDLTVVHGARHMQPSRQVPGGYRAWAERRLIMWGFAALPAAPIGALRSRP